MSQTISEVLLSILVIVIVFLVRALHFKRVKLREVEKNYEEERMSHIINNKLYLETVKSYDTVYDERNYYQKEVKRLISDYDKHWEKIKKNPLQYIYFTKVKDSEILRRVTIETEVNEGNKVIKINAIIRKKINDKYQKVTVKAHLCS